MEASPRSHEQDQKGRSRLAPQSQGRLRHGSSNKRSPSARTTRTSHPQTVRARRTRPEDPHHQNLRPSWRTKETTPPRRNTPPKLPHRQPRQARRETRHNRRADNRRGSKFGRNENSIHAKRYRGSSRGRPTARDNGGVGEGRS